LQVIFTNNKDLLNKKVDNVLFTNDSFEKVFKELEQEGFKEIVIGGGSELNTSLIKKDLIDEIRVIIKPIVIGKGKSLFGEIGEIKKFKVNSVEKLPYGSIEISYVKDY